jgi:hypothetical protein
MQLDSVILKVGDGVFHLLNGEGTVQTVSDNSATASFGAQVLTINSATITQRGIKIIGIEKPLIFWRSNRGRRPVEAYKKIIEQMDEL